MSTRVRETGVHMPSRIDHDTLVTLERARRVRERLQNATCEEREFTIAFMRCARTARWSWRKIGASLGVTETAARRYYGRNNGG